MPAVAVKCPVGKFPASELPPATAPPALRRLERRRSDLARIGGAFGPLAVGEVSVLVALAFATQFDLLLETGAAQIIFFVVKLGTLQGTVVEIGLGVERRDESRDVLWAGVNRVGQRLRPARTAAAALTLPFRSSLP